MNTITIYKSDECGACATVVPLIKRLARNKGVNVKVIDVDECGKKCDGIKYVPYIEVDGRKMDDVSQLANMLR